MYDESVCKNCKRIGDGNEKVLIVGAGKGGSALLKMFHETKLMDVVAIVDRNEDAPGIKAAREMGIQTSKHWRDVLTDDLDIIVEVTGDDEVFTALRKEVRGIRSLFLVISLTLLRSLWKKKSNSLRR